MRRIAWVGFAWFLAALFAFSPVLSSAPVASAQSTEGTPVGDELPTETPVTETPSETPIIVDPTATIAPTDEPSETATEPAQPTATEPATEEPTVAVTETETATEEATEEPTSEPTKKPTQPPGFTASAVTDLEITISCTTSPERVQVKNIGASNILLKGVSSYVDLIPEEPFAISRNLKPGQIAHFQSGAGAQSGTVLTTKYIFTNTAWEREGVRFNTSAGGASKKCDPPPPSNFSDLKVTLSCNTAAETIRVANNGTGWVTIKGLATYIDPIEAEPFAVWRVLKPGQTATFQAGLEARFGTILTKEYIFTNAAYEKDGIRVNTSVGKLFKACPPKPVPPEKWIEVNLSRQYLIAWVGNTRVNETWVSTGKPGFETPTGTYYVLYRYRYDTMAGCIQGECYYVPDVPWTQYFTNRGHALHGAYWHNDFGRTRSHGCINLPLWFAEWLWNWATYGTRLWIHY